MDALLTASQEIEVAQRGLTWEKVRLIRSSEKSAVALARELRISDSTIGKVRRGVIWADEAGPRHGREIGPRLVPRFVPRFGPRLGPRIGIPKLRASNLRLRR